MSAGFAHAVWIPLHLVAFFTGCVACHGALARARPAAERGPARFTWRLPPEVYSAAFSLRLVAPVVFSQVVEYPLAVILACLVAPSGRRGYSVARLRRSMQELLLPGVVFFLTAILATNQAGLADSVIGSLGVMIASGLGMLATVTPGTGRCGSRFAVAAVLVASGLSSGVSGRLIHVERSFFGVVRVTHDSERTCTGCFTAPRCTGSKASTRHLPGAFDLLHPFRADRPGVRVALAAVWDRLGRESQSSV